MKEHPTPPDLAAQSSSYVSRTLKCGATIYVGISPELGTYLHVMADGSIPLTEDELGWLSKVFQSYDASRLKADLRKAIGHDGKARN